MFDHSSIQRGSFYWVRPKIGRMELKTIHLHDLALFKMEVKIPAESQGYLKYKHKILKCLPLKRQGQPREELNSRKNWIKKS